MSTRLLKLLSIFVSLVLIFNMLPLQVLAAGVGDTPQSQVSALPDSSSSGSATAYQRLDTATIVEEDVSRRGEYYKEFVLNNGLRLAAVYADPVHFEEDGQWADIDNTLQAVSVRGVSGYTNTAGVWQVYFPQQLTGSNAISVTKDGYTVSFGMAGELTNSGNIAVASIGASSDILAVSSVRSSAAQIRAVDLTEQKTAAQYEQTVLEKHHSKLAYASVYDNTEIVYDLTGNRLKESIVISKYDASLWGYRYNLNTGGLIPVLLEDNTIELRHPETAEVIMTMPAPFMVDANDEYSYDVNVSLVQMGCRYLLSYYVPRQWLASPDRGWPVVLDPVVQAGTGSTNIQDISFTPTVTETYRHSTLKVGYSTGNGVYRTYMRFVDLPSLGNADYIAKATVSIYKPMNTSKTIPVEVHRVNQTWTDRTIAWGNNDDFNEIVEDYAIAEDAGWYQWDITGIARGWYEDPVNSLANNTGLMFKTTDTIETAGSSNWHQFCSSNYSDYNDLKGTSPQLLVVFRNSNGLESYWNYTSGSAGRAGAGYINNFTGGLTWIHNDIGFGGNRMPVSISHIYNIGETSSNAFGMGYGWRTNFHQSVRSYEEGVKPYYVWHDSDGTQHYFYQTEEDINTYQDEDGLSLTLTVVADHNCSYKIVDKLGNTSYFDSQGRLYKMANNQEEPSSITIEYCGTTNQISKVIDGVGREYRFTYSGGPLTRIGYYSTGETEIAYVAFSYTSNNLTAITYQDNTENAPKQSRFTYDSNHRLTEAQDIDGYSLEYTYTLEEMGKPIKVETVTEYSRSGESATAVEGWKYTFSYVHNQTVIQDQYGMEQILQFNDWGNVISVQDDEGRAQVDLYDSNSVADATEKHLNQINKSSKLQDTVVNLLKDSSFESGTLWTADAGVTQAVTIESAYLGSKALKVVNSNSTQAGVTAFTKYVGPTSEYTLSAYVKTEGNTTAWLSISGGGISAVSETLSENQEWTRLEANFYNSTGEPQTIYAKLIVDGSGPVYIDCAQMEWASTASRYNLIDNGDFSFGSDSWIMSEKCDSDEKVVLLSDVIEDYESRSVRIGGHAFQIVGDPTSKLRIRQELPVSGEAGDVYVLAGWALGQGVPLTEQSTGTRTYTLRGQFLYTDGDTGVFEFDFNSSVDGSCWQYAGGAMLAEKAYDGIKIQVLFDFAANTVYFDSIQLFKESFGNSYTYDVNGNIEKVDSTLNETTLYSYDKNNLTTVTLPTGAEMTYTYDDHHNVKTATTAEGVVYTYEYDGYGNNTSVSITVGNVKIESKVEYEADGNRIKSTTDAAGNVTTYSYNADTNVLEWTKAPGETDDTRTNYTYDAMYRLANVSANVDGLSEGTALTAAYTYTNDLLTSLQSGSTTYTFTYGDFALRTGVNIGSRNLANYRYNDKHALRRLDYGNGDSVNYTYDRQGRLTGQYYEDNTRVTYKYDNSGLQSYVYDSATDTTTWYYYDFADRLSRVEKTSPYAAHSVEYTFDELSNITAQTETINGVARTTDYTYDDDNRITSVAADGGTRNYVYDSYGRLVEQVTSNKLTETFTYRSVSSTALTGQVETHRISAVEGYDITYTYGYDTKGNIISVSDGSYPTSYVYDSQGQLIRENNWATGSSYTWTYDDAGNITSKSTYSYNPGTLGNAHSTVTYTYGDADWGDLLTAYNGVPITYDTIGNPLSYGEWTYTWEHGRQLASMSDGTDTWDYEYDASGMRIRRSNGTTTYTYVYNGGLLMQMTRGTDILRFTYDASGRPMAVTFNGTVYYYVTNIQGDVLLLLDSNGTPVDGYTYDAWGNISSVSSSTIGTLNPLRYRSYVYDQETGLYYLQSRYYNPQWGRFINADNQLSIDDLVGANLFAYCGNNPVNRVDPTGEAWWHWAVAAAVVAACAVATVVTCGGFAAAATAVCMVGSGVAAATTASTIAAGAFIGSATVYGMAVLTAASTSNSVQEFCDQGNWSTVALTIEGGLTGAYDGYIMSPKEPTQEAPNNETFLPDSFYKKHAPKQSTPNSSYTNYTYNDRTGRYDKSTAYYDSAGRQVIRIDWTNHGYSNHGNPHVHYTTYNSMYRDGKTVRWD